MNNHVKELRSDEEDGSYGCLVTPDWSESWTAHLVAGCVGAISAVAALGAMTWIARKTVQDAGLMCNRTFAEKLLEDMKQYEPDPE